MAMQAHLPTLAAIAPICYEHLCVAVTGPLLHVPGAGWSTMAPDDAEVEGAMGVYLRAALPRLRGLDRSPLNRAAAWLQARLIV